MIPHRQRSIRKLRALICTVAFSLVLVAPFASLLLQPDWAILGFPYPRSVADLESYPKQLKTYFAASVDLRRHLANVHQKLIVRINGRSQVGDVVLGQNGWLFWEFLMQNRELRKTKVITYESLRGFQRQMESNHLACARHGAIYLPVFVPAKNDVYPEHLPAVASRRHTFNIQRMMRFLNAKSTLLKPVETLSELRALKDYAPVFFKTDSHWTSFGGFAASRAVGDRLRQTIPHLQLSGLDDIEVTVREVDGGNEAKILGADGELKDTYPEVAYRDSNKVRWESGDELNVPLINVFSLAGTNTSVFPTGEIETGMVFHNSFGYALVKHVGRYFEKTIWIWGEFNEEAVAERRPQVVIELYFL